MDIIMKQKFPDLEPRALAAVLHAVRAAYIYRNGYTTKVPVKIISEVRRAGGERGKEGRKREGEKKGRGIRKEGKGKERRRGRK